MSGAQYGEWLRTPEVDDELVRTAFSRFPSGVAAICAEVDGELNGMVATSFSMGASFDPPLVMFAAQNSSSTWPRLRRAARIGVTVLGSGQTATCMQLASRASAERFTGLEVDVTPDGAALLHGSPIWLECVVLSETPTGDHQLVVLEVKRLSVVEDFEPLVYHARSFHGLQASA